MANKNKFKAEKLPISATQFAQCVAINSPFYDLSSLNEVCLPSASGIRDDSARFEDMHHQISRHVDAAKANSDSTHDIAHIDALSKDITRALGNDMSAHLRQLMAMTQQQLAQHSSNSEPFELSPLPPHENGNDSNHNCNGNQPQDTTTNTIDLTQSDDDAKTVVLEDDDGDEDAGDSENTTNTVASPNRKRKRAEALAAAAQGGEASASPDSTPPKPAKRRKLTHRRSSGHLSSSQTPFLQPNSMSLSQASQNSENTALATTLNNGTSSLAQAHINNIQAYFVEFYTQFHGGVGEVPLGGLDIGEEESECEQPTFSWMTLRYKLESLARSHDVQRVQTTALEPLLRLIDDQLALSMEAELVNAAHILFAEDVEMVAKGIQAAIIALYIMTAKDIPRSLVQEDIFTKIQRLITFHIERTFVPCKDETQRQAVVVQQQQEEEEEDAENRDTSNSKNKNHKSKKRGRPSKRVRKQASQETVAEFWRSLAQDLHALYADFCSSLLLLFNVYYEREVVPEQYISNLVQCCFAAFEAQHIDDIQDGCKALLVTIFVRYAPHRSLIRNKCIEYYRGEHAFVAQRRVTDSKDKQRSHIHLINALILEMCQCVANHALVVATTEQCSEPAQNNCNPQHQQEQLFRQCVMAPMHECRRLLRGIVSDIVNVATSQKAARKLHMFYGDCENVWDLVEWPIAEFALYVTLHAFHQILKSGKLEQKQYQHMRPYFIQGIASICCTAREAVVAGKRCHITCTAAAAAKQSQQQQPPPKEGGGGVADPLADDQKIDCKCGDNRKYAALNERFMLTCDDCDSWSHGDCVGFATQDELPSHWVCDMCRLNRDIDQHLLRINACGSGTSTSALDTDTKLHILLVNYLSKQLASSSSSYSASPYLARLSSHALSARQFHVVRWLWLCLPQSQASTSNTNSPTTANNSKKAHTHKSEKNGEHTKIDVSVLRLFEDYFRLPQSSLLKSLPTFSEHGIHAINMQLALDRRLIVAHHSYIVLLCHDLKHTSAKSRSKALRALKDICDIDSSVLRQQRIQQAIMDRFHDKSASVREAAVDLIGHYVMHDATLVEVYFEQLEKRIHDTFISVRKRAIRIFRDICLQRPDNAKYKAICLALFAKMSENNESIKKLVASTFEEMWFAPNDVLCNRCVTQTHKSGSRRFSAAFKQLVQQIIDIVAECESEPSQASTGHYLIELIDKMLQREDKKTKRAQLRSDAEKTRVFAVCEDMCSVVMDKLCVCRSAASTATSSARRCLRIQSFVHTLFIFCKVRPSFLVRHFNTLQSYLSKPEPLKISPFTATAELTPAQQQAKADYLAMVQVMHRLSQILTTIVAKVERSEVTTQSYVQLQNVLIQNLWNVISFDEILVSNFYMDTVQCLCAVVTHLSRHYEFVTSKIFDLCMSALYAKRHGLRWCDTKWCKNKKNEVVPPLQVIKALLFLGTTIKHFDIDACCPRYQFAEYKQQQQQANVVRLVYEMYRYFCSDALVRPFHRYAVRGFVALFSRDPSLMELPTTVETISSFLRVGDESECIECEACLTALHEFFETEERRTEFLQLETEKSTNQKLQKSKQKTETETKEVDAHEDDADADGVSEGEDAELSDDDEEEDDEETGLNTDVAHLRRASFDKCDSEFLVQFIADIVDKICELSLSDDAKIRLLCAQILLDWTSSSWVNPVEMLKEIIALCLDEQERTRDVANTALHKICERYSKMFGFVGIDGFKRAFALYSKAMRATLIDFDDSSANANANANAVILQQLVPEQVPKLFQVLQEMSKSQQQQIMSSISRAMLEHSDYAYCVTHHVVLDRHCHFQIPVFVFFMCQLLCAIPFETYLPAQPFAVVQHLDCQFKHVAPLKQALVDAEQHVQTVIRGLDCATAIENSEELVQGLKACYEHSCHALMYVVLYQFRAFWRRLYNLSEDGIAGYKLCVNNKNKTKEFKAKKMSAEAGLTFVLELPRKDTLVHEMKSLYEALFVQKTVVALLPHSNTQPNTKKPNTRSRAKKTQPTTDNTALFRIPEILNVIQAEFLSVCDAVHIPNHDSGVFSQLDSDVLSNDDADGGGETDDGGDTVMVDKSKTKLMSKPKPKTKPKAKKKKQTASKPQPTRSRPSRACAKKKKEILISEEELELDLETSDQSNADDQNDSDY